MKAVTGPGRSGTSLVAKILIASGADFGRTEDHIPPDENNPDGYFEDIEFVSVNVGLALGTWFDARRMILGRPKNSVEAGLFALAKVGYLFPANQRLATRRTEDLNASMRAVVRRLGKGFVKCTRLPTVLDAWHGKVKFEKIVYVYRDPAQVASSLQRAYNLPVILGFRLWRIRVSKFLDFVDRSTEMPVMFVNFDSLVSETTRRQEIKRIISFALDLSPVPSTLNTLEKLVKPHVSSSVGIRIPGRVKRLYARLNQLSSGSANAL